MSMGLLFWILVIVCVIFNGLVVWGPGRPYGPFGSNLLVLILFVLLGWAVFGAPIK